MKTDNSEYSDRELTGSKHAPIPPSIVPVSRGNCIPLSFAQQRLWIHDQMEPAVPNNIGSVLRIKGTLRMDVLQRALDEIVERHEILRTTYTVVGGEPVQIVKPKRPVRIIQNDLINCPEDERENEIRRCIREEVRKGFDLSRDLMMRTILIRLSAAEYVLVVTMHHIASDGWSMMTFFRELTALYGAFAEGRPSPLRALPVQYADFAYWRRQSMSGECLERQLSYWIKQLEGSPSLLELPMDRPRPAFQNLSGASHTISLPEPLAASLRMLSRQEGVTMFVMMMAAFKTLLFRYTGQTDLSVGTLVANREWPEVRGLIGFFQNAIVLRTHLDDGPGFREFLQRELKVIQDAYEHYDMPFEKLVEALNPQRDSGHTPLFQVALMLDDMPSAKLELPELSIEAHDTETYLSFYDLMLVITDSSSDMRLSFIYRTDLFETAAIQRMAANFRTLLEGIVSLPEESIFTLPVLDRIERQQIHVDWSGSMIIPPAGECIHALFEAQAERTPDSIALVFEDSQMTYSELNRRANKLAHYLMKMGVGPEVLVGIYEERSLEMIVGLFGILKAGGAYVPLDPGYPQERINLMIEDADVKILITDSRLSERIPSYRGKLLCLDADWDLISRESSETPFGKTSSDNAACIIYTSGSTGRPKGTILQHGSIVNFIKAAISQYGLESSDRILQFASISFDASAEEIYPCLSIGATLVLRTDDMLAETVFYRKCEDRKVTVLSLPTAYWHLLTHSLGSQDMNIPASVRMVIIGGERALPERLAQWQQHAGMRVKLLNTYGPTEATVITTLIDITVFDTGSDFKRDVPIGRPVPGARIYILDSHLQPVPIGVPGELYIGGSVLARGYLNRPDLTAEKFVPDVFSQDKGDRLYKTGDIARYMPDGNIEFIGRFDHQVKIRGFRIELGEIEAVLRQHPAVQEAIVTAREDRPGDKRVAAYVVPEDGTAIHVRELRDYLVVMLPNYMVPSAIVLIESFPLTPNNKVDRNALPVPDQSIQRVNGEYVAPRTDLESRLADIWGNVLGVSPVGVTDNFFELGGHSLLAVRLSSEIRKIAGKDIPVMAIFHNPTIEQLSMIIASGNWAGQWSSVVKFHAAGTKIPLFSVHDTNLARYLNPDQPYYILTHPRADEDLDPYDTIEKIAAKNILEMRSVQPKGPYIIIGFCLWSVVAMEMSRQLIQKGNDPPHLFLVEPLDMCLEHKPLPDSKFSSRLIHLRKNLAQLRTLDGIGRIGRNIYHLIRKKTSILQIKYMTIVMLCKVYSLFGQLPPQRMRQFYFHEYYSNKLLDNYIPGVISGKAVLFYADKKTATEEQWKAAINGGVEIYEVAGAKHLEIHLEPYVQKWCKILHACLDRVNSSNREKGVNNPKSL